MSEGPSIDDYSAEFWRRAKVASNVLHLARLVRPQDEEVGTLYRYRLFELDGAECGEAHYAVLIEPGEIIWTGDGRKLRVVDVVPVEEDDSPFVGFLRVEPTKKTTVGN
jgi:hypothetical protein